MSTYKPIAWEVRPAGIEQTKFGDPESFYLWVRRSRWQEQETFIVTRFPYSSSTAFTAKGAEVFLRHDVNAKWAHHESRTSALAIASDIVDGRIETVNYQTWRKAEERHFASVTPTTDPEEPTA